MIRRIPIGVIQQNTVKLECFLREMEKLSIQREGTWILLHGLSTPGELDVDKFLGLLSIIYKLGKAGYISSKLV